MIELIEQQQPYPNEVLKLFDGFGFIELYQQLVKDGCGKMEAYNRLEVQHIRLLGRRKFSTYISFKFATKGKYGISI